MLQTKQAAAPAGAKDAGGDAEGNIGPQQPGNAPPPLPAQVEKRSLLSQAAAAKKGKPEESENERLIREEQELLRNITRQKALMGAKELAKVHNVYSSCRSPFAAESVSQQLILAPHI